MAAEYDTQEERGLQNHSLCSTHNDTVQCSTPHISNNEAKLHVHPAYITYTLHLLLAQASHRKDTVFVESMSCV